MTPVSSHTMAGKGHRSAGFSLIEVMIAMFVMGVGLLGFALLQTMVLRYTQSANYRTQATNLAYDLFDQIRANRMLLTTYSDIKFDSFGSVTGANCAQAIDKDFLTPAASMQRWRCQLRAALGPQAEARVTASPDGNVAVVINWSDARGAVGEAEDDADQGYGKVTVSTQL